MSTSETCEVCIIGGGPAGLTAGLFTARAGLETVLIDAGSPILERNAHLENVPGFPVGLNARLFLDMLREQADRNDVDRRDEPVLSVTTEDDQLLVECDGGEQISARYVICTSWASTDYLDGLAGIDIVTRGSKSYINVEENGSTDVSGLYAAGRIAGTHHQTVVAAGDGASVALHVVEESDVPFYHDWVAPEGYFTDRGRDVPPGCEEIDEAERREREHKSRMVMREYFAEPHPAEPTQHPSLEQ